MKKTLFSVSELLTLLTIGVLFIIATQLSTSYTDVLEQYIGRHTYTGPVFYILSAILATVIAPVSATPLIPIASSLWGPNLAALYSITGWTIGACIAFWLAKRYGYERIARVSQLKKIQEYALHLPKKNIFWSVVLLRITLPVDILSYALGLFSDMTFGSYVLATIVGITPFAFIFAYTAQMPLLLQVAVLACTGIIAIYGYFKFRSSLQQENNPPTNN